MKFTRQVRFWVAMSLLWPYGACAFDGDVNSDATLDVSDVQCLVLAILDLNPDGSSSLPCLEDLSAADMNGDSVLNIVDLQLLVRAILGPHPFPEDPGPPPPVPPLIVELNEGTNMSAAISPNGESIAFTLQGTLWLVPVEGGEATALTDAMGDSHIPTWSPDSQWIAFQSFRSGSYHIWKIRADGTGLEQLTHGVHDDREPHWSPSGTHLAFSSDRSGSYDIWTITLATGELERRTSTVDDASWPCYSPNGEQIAILSEEKGLYLLKEDQEEPEFIFAGSDISAPS